MKTLVSKITISTLVFASLGLSSVAFAQETSFLYFSPASKTVNPGEVFEVAIMVDSQDEYVNAVTAQFFYPEDKLELLDIDIAESIMPFFIEMNAASGKVVITGGKPTPGFTGKNYIASVKFQAIASTDAATLSFTENSAVLTNDTNKDIFDLNSSQEGVYTIKAPTKEQTTTESDGQASILSSFISFLKSLLPF